jgi:hypothetical protein
MTWTITGARSRWGALARVEKDYVITWLVIGITFVLSELLRINNLTHKFISVLCLGLLVLYVLYLILLPILIKKFSFNIPFAALYGNQDEWQNRRKWILFDCMWFLLLPINLSVFFEEAHFLIKGILLIFWMTIFFFGFLYSYYRIVGK